MSTGCRAGVIFFQFHKLTTEETGMAEMDVAQKEWLAIIPYTLSLQYNHIPKPPESPARKFCYNVAQSDWFEYLVLFLVICSVVEMCFWWRGMDPQLIKAKETLNIVISVAFSVRFSLQIACWYSSLLWLSSNSMIISMSF